MRYQPAIDAMNARVGMNLSLHRTTAELSPDDLAAKAVTMGWIGTGTDVMNMEAGTRIISAAELALFAICLNIAPYNFARLFASPAPDRIPE